MKDVYSWFTSACAVEVSLLLSKIYFSLGSKMMSGMTNILANVEKFLFLQMCIKSMNWHRGMSQYCN